MRAIVFNPGTHPAPRAIASALAAEGCLVSYLSGIGASPRMLRATSWLPSPVRNELEKRSVSAGVANSHRGKLSWFADAFAVLAARRGNGVRQESLLRRRNEILFRLLEKQLRAAPRGTVVVFPTGTHVPVASLCARYKLRTVAYTTLPEPSYSDAVLFDEGRRNPVWAGYLGEVRHPVGEAREALEADIVLANSEFTGSTYVDLHSRVLTIPLAVDVFGPVGDRPRRDGPELRIVFVGQLTQRKGLSYLFEALEQADFQYQLDLIGPDPLGMGTALVSHFPTVNVQLEGILSKAEIIRRLPEYDVFAFPTLLDSFGNALAEAVSVGLPVVATARSGAPDMGIFPDAGIKVDPQSSDALRDALRQLANDHDLRSRMSQRSRSLMVGRSWKAYGLEAVRAIRHALDSPSNPMTRHTRR